PARRTGICAKTRTRMAEPTTGPAQSRDPRGLSMGIPTPREDTRNPAAKAVCNPVPSATTTMAVRPVVIPHAEAPASAGDSTVVAAGDLTAAAIASQDPKMPTAEEFGKRRRKTYATHRVGVQSVWLGQPPKDYRRCRATHGRPFRQ